MAAAEAAVTAAAAVVDAGAESDPENPTPDHRRSLRGASAPLMIWHRTTIEFGWRAGTPPAAATEAAPAQAPVVATPAVPEVEYDFIWDPVQGCEVKVPRSTPAPVSAPPVAPPPRAELTAEQLNEAIAVRMFAFKANGELVETQICSARGGVKEPVMQGPYDPAGVVRADMDLIGPPHESVIVFFVVGRPTNHLPMNLNRVTCRFVLSTQKEVAWMNIRDDSIPTGACVVVSCFVIDHAKKNLRNEYIWRIERLGIPLPHSSLSDVIPELQKILKTRFLAGIARANAKLVDLTKTPPVMVTDKSITVGLSWEYQLGNEAADLDLSAVVIRGMGYSIDPPRYEFVTANNLRHGMGHSVVHSGDATFGTSPRRAELNGDDEQIVIDFEKLPADVLGIYIVVSCYEDLRPTGSATADSARGYLTLRSGADQTRQACMKVKSEWNANSSTIAWEIRPYTRTDYPHWRVTEVMHGFYGSDPLADSACQFFVSRGFDLSRDREGIDCYLHSPFGLAPLVGDPVPLHSDAISTRKADYPVMDEEREDVLFVNVIHGVRLMAGDKKNGVLSTSDPYVRLSMTPADHHKEHYKTRVCKETLNPTWDETFSFNKPMTPGSQVLLQVYDKDLFGSKFLGQVEVQLTSTHIHGPQMFMLKGETFCGLRAEGFLVLQFAWNMRSRVGRKNPAE